MKRKTVFFNNDVMAENVQTKIDNVDIEDALDLAGTGRYNIMALTACCIINLGAVMDLLGFSLIIPASSCDLHLDLQQSGILASVPFCGFLFGLPWGYLADTQGRHKALVISVAFGFVFSFLSSFSTNFWMMFILKFIGSTPVALTMTYLGEVTPRKYRNRFIFILNVFYLAPDFFCYATAYLTLPLEFSIDIYIITFRPWRLLTMLMTIPLVVGWIMLSFLHDSPKFLANKDETDEALNILKKVYEINGGVKEQYPVNTLLGGIKESEPISFWNSVLKQTVPIFKPPLLWRTLQLFYLLSISISINNVFYMWFPTLANTFFTSSEAFENDGFCKRIISNVSSISYAEIQVSCNDSTPLSTIYSGLLFSLCFSTLSTLTVLISSWRKLLLIFSFAISGVSCILLNNLYDPVAIIILFMLVQFCGICCGSVGTYFVDIFPTSYRGMAISLGIVSEKLLCLVGVNVVGATIVNYCSLTFYCSSILLLGAIVVALFLPSDRKPAA